MKNGRDSMIYGGRPFLLIFLREKKILDKVPVFL